VSRGLQFPMVPPHFSPFTPNTPHVRTIRQIFFVARGRRLGIDGKTRHHAS
jgi:hypothetical protein